MSRVASPRVDQASQAPGAPTVAPGSIVEFSTAGIAPKERLAFWRDTVLKRMVPLKALDQERPFEARLRRVIGLGVELVEHSSDAILAERTVQRCAADDI